MTRQDIANIFARVPVSFLTAAVLGYFGYDIYNFYYSDTSPLLQKKHDVEGMRETNLRTTKTVTELEQFVRGLESKKLDLRQLAQQLSDTKATLSDTFD